MANLLVKQLTLEQVNDTIVQGDTVQKIAENLCSGLEVEDDLDLLEIIYDGELQQLDDHSASELQDYDLECELDQENDCIPKQPTAKHVHPDELLTFAIACANIRDVYAAISSDIVDPVEVETTLLLIHKLQRKCVHTASRLRRAQSRTKFSTALTLHDFGI